MGTLTIEYWESINMVDKYEYKFTDDFKTLKNLKVKIKTKYFTINMAYCCIPSSSVDQPLETTGGKCHSLAPMNPNVSFKILM